jgi:hypothetical protein
LLISFPFKPTLIKVGPSHVIKAYVIEKARPEKANDAMTGAPSPWKVLKMMTMQARDSAERFNTSDRVRLEDMSRDDAAEHEGQCWKSGGIQVDLSLSITILRSVLFVCLVCSTLSATALGPASRLPHLR